MIPRPYFNRSASLNDPEVPEPETPEMAEARELAEAREVEAAIDRGRGDDNG